MGNEPPFPWELLSPDHDLETFDCDRSAAKEYLRQRALADQQSGNARTYVACRGERAIAYFTVAAGSVEAALSPDGIAKRRRRRSIPVVLLIRLGVDVSEQSHGLEEAAFFEALLRSAAAADTIGARAVIVGGKDQDARAFYQRYGFEPLPTSAFHLFLAVKDIRQSLGRDSVAV